MKKTALSIMLSSAMLFGAQAAMYYSTGAIYPTGGSSWNTAADGSGAAGFSGTYGHSGNDITIQAADSMYINNSSTSLDWDANSYTFENGAIFKSRPTAVTSSFNGGDLTISGASVTFMNAVAAGAGNSGGGLVGSAKVQLGSNTLVLDQSTSAASGIFELGLNVVGSGTIDFNFANANCTWTLSNLSSDYTGTIQGDTFNGVVQLGAGDGAINAGLVVGRADQTRTGKLDVAGSFSIGALDIDGVSVVNGIYTYPQLVAFGTANSANFSNNLVDNGGTVFVGQAIPEPGTLGLMVLMAGGIFFCRRIKGC